ncbi:MAG: hypothetical protein COB04_16240 [Gammaproteobacteria bacterium]|nr:MAG: hypothetical protein COB04_16240 [Gammaproteobacteria bacterium]
MKSNFGKFSKTAYLPSHTELGQEQRKFNINLTKAIIDNNAAHHPILSAAARITEPEEAGLPGTSSAHNQARRALKLYRLIDVAGADIDRKDMARYKILRDDQRARIFEKFKAVDADSKNQFTAGGTELRKMPHKVTERSLLHQGMKVHSIPKDITNQIDEMLGTGAIGTAGLRDTLESSRPEKRKRPLDDLPDPTSKR